MQPDLRLNKGWLMEEEERFGCVAPYEQTQHQPNNTFPQWQF
jgi:hypothetical protein